MDSFYPLIKLRIILNKKKQCEKLFTLFDFDRGIIQFTMSKKIDH